MKKRIDVILVEKGHIVGREKAKSIIMAGLVYVDQQKIDKAGTMVEENAKIEVRGDTLKYVSRGGLKLEKAITNFDISLQNAICCDIGASTGGFTDCMLQNNASKVYAIDVGYGQLAWSLRIDERVVNMERTNIRYVTN
ncbi:MAG: TlyA family RNA methyltransferase, partial [Oscillospiraceae bacterium]